MNKQEFTVLAKGMKSVYTSERFLPDAYAMKTWYEMLCDLDYNSTLLAVKTYMLTNKYPPTIADIREMESKVTRPEEQSWSEAWEQVLKAISKYGIYSETEAMESLNPITKQVIKRLGWRDICMSENIGVERANFRMIYEQEIERKNEQAKLPEGIKEAIKELVDSSKLLECGKEGGTE